MANLKQCSRCRSVVDISYFGMNRKKEPYKTCAKCRKQKIKSTTLKKADTDTVSTMTPDTSETEEYVSYKVEKTYKPSISIDATDVAALLGLHKYKTNLHEIIMKYWIRGFPKKYRDTYDKLEKEGFKFESVKTEHEEIKEACLAKGISIDFDTLSDVDDLRKLLDKEENLNANIDDITSFCNKQFGIQFEKRAIKQYEKQLSVKVDAVENYVKRVFKEDGVCNWLVGGRVDGVIGFDRIVEIKNRKKGFYPCIPLYEILQVYTYMFAMSINQASLVEMYDGDIQDTNFIYTRGYETYALAKLNKFCIFMEEFVNDADLNEQFMKCSVDDIDQLAQINKGLLDKLDIKHMVNAKINPIKDIITKTKELPNTIECVNDTSFIMVFDVEHSGTCESHILQLSWGMYTKDGALVRSTDLYVKPDGYININPHVSKKIHLTYEELLSKSNSLPIKELLTLFMADASKCKKSLFPTTCQQTRKQ